ncbi:MAG TPA: glycosyltransferase family 2 protein [Brevundimonas sp.]|jgi:succinoglycan biosynthesis protein ExoM|uniref:glycosyltransferase family 2 protein n=1 Tax=Brevundimonas sp. TaxID=1871086 RepID=UPI002CD7DD34|nr:glycosyltransferase family 2 protein [Brevundimonas sp.]HRH20376.1 glycosyltransferase family 2 protein [Brevundimonas sp.]
MTRVAVLIPTLRRPAQLEAAIRSVMAQTGPLGQPDEMVVSDNDPDGSARATVEAIRCQAPFPIKYVHVPTPGISTARNAALATTEAELIAFLDDDEIASPGWLSALRHSQAQLGAEVVFGPIQGRAPGADEADRAYLERFFGRAGPQTDTLIPAPFGCGNSLFVRARTLVGPTPFDLSADQSGGEDDALFQVLRQQGVRWGWSAGAWVEEAAPPHRARLSYAMARAFAFGQGPAQTAAREGNWLGVGRWMVIGAGQFVVFGATAAVQWLIGGAHKADWTDRAVRGLGKMFWMKPFEPQFYGLAELKRTQRSG